MKDMLRRDGLKEYRENTKTKLENTVNERPSSNGMPDLKTGLLTGAENRCIKIQEIV